MHVDCIVGMSLDGRIDWIKNPEKLSEIYYGLVMKTSYDAILCGSNTILKAEMDETSSIKYSNQTLVVVDSKAKIKNWEIIKKQAWWNEKPIVLCSDDTCREYLQTLEQLSIDYIICGKERVDLSGAIEKLEKKHSITRMRIDSGGALIGAMLRNRLINTITVIIAPQLTGGISPQTIFSSSDVSDFESIIDIRLEDCRTQENGYVLLKYSIVIANS